jgi:Ras-related protein Rab-7A
MARPPVLKMVLLGDAGVGKSALMQRFVQNKFSGQYHPTVGADFASKEILVHGRLVTLQLWETAGQERFKSLGTAFYRGADACLLVCDVTDARSFERLDAWREDFLLHAALPDVATFPFVVLANKVDLVAQRQVSSAALRDWTARTNIAVFEVAAKSSSLDAIAMAFLVAAENVRQTRPPVVPPLHLAPRAKKRTCRP